MRAGYNSAFPRRELRPSCTNFPSPLGRAATAYPDALLRDYFKLPELEIYETAWDTVLEKYMPVDLASPLFGYRLLLDTIEIQVVPATQWFFNEQ